MSITPKSPLKSALLGLTAAGIVAFAISALAGGPGTPSTSQQIQSDNSKQEENMPAAPAKNTQSAMQNPARQNMNRSATADMPAEATEADQEAAASKSAPQNMARPGQAANRSAAAGMPAPTAAEEQQAPQSNMPASQPGMNRSTGHKQQEMRSANAQPSAPAAMREANAPVAAEAAPSNPQAAQQQPGMTRSASTADNSMLASQMQQRADETGTSSDGTVPSSEHPAPTPCK